MLRTVSSSPLAPSVKVKLLNAGFHTGADLQDVEPHQLCREAGISQEDAEEVLQTFRNNPRGLGREKAAVEGLTALDLLQEEQSWGNIVTFCSELDAVLGGGVSVGRSTEICGVPGIGKTQLCLQLAVDVQIPACFGGLGGKALFIDTEGGFIVQRLVDMAEAAVEHCSLLAEDEEQQETLENFTLEMILSGVFLVRCHDYVDLLAEVYLLPDFLKKHPEVRLVVIDSVAFPFRHDFEDLSQRTRLLNGFSQQLVQLATQNNIAVVLTNQMTTKITDIQSRLVPALGNLVLYDVRVGVMQPHREWFFTGTEQKGWRLSSNHQAALMPPSTIGSRLKDSEIQSEMKNVRQHHLTLLKLKSTTNVPVLKTIKLLHRYDRSPETSS